MKPFVAGKIVSRGVQVLIELSATPPSDQQRYDFDGQHDIVAKRSTDGGRRWGPLQVVADPAKQLNCSLGSLILPRCEFWDPTVLYDSERCETLIMSACKSRCFLDLSRLLRPLTRKVLAA